MKNLILDIVLWLLASPILFVQWILRMVKQIRFWTAAYSPHLPCRNCGSRISLVGIWKCGCGFTSRSHLVRHCPCCSSLPRVVRCVNCGVTLMLPEEP